MILGLALAAVVGLALGLLGGGGSTLSVPILVYVVGFEVKQAIALSLVLVGATSLIGAAGHWRAGNVRVGLASVFGLIAMAATYVGARWSVLLSGTAQLVLFSAVMMAAASFMFRSAPEPAVEGLYTAVKGNPIKRGALIVGGAAGVGLLTGLVGVGGGFLIVPALVIAARTPMKVAVGTSLLVIAMNSVAGFAGYYGRVEIPWLFMAEFTGLSMVGVMIGMRLVHHVSQSRLKRMFAVFLLLMGGLILIQNVVQGVRR